MKYEKMDGMEPPQTTYSVRKSCISIGLKLQINNPSLMSVSSLISTILPESSLLLIADPHRFLSVNMEVSSAGSMVIPNL